MVRIVADSTCDLGEFLATKYNIAILPLHVVLGEDEYLDGVNITPEIVFNWSDANNETPKTSAPSIEDAIKIFKPILDNGDDIVAISISRNISSSATVMNLAAQELDAEERVKVVDSKSLSYSMGLVAIKAAMIAREGKSLNEVYNEALSMVDKVQTSFVVDSLTYLHRGGRCNGIAAMAGGVLKIHPVINMDNGALIPGNKYRGKINKVIKEYVNSKLDDINEKGFGIAVVAYTGEIKDIANEVKTEIEELNVFDEILVLPAGCVIASHCGPSTFAVFYSHR